jgi:hypothetical protein
VYLTVPFLIKFPAFPPIPCANNSNAISPISESHRNNATVFASSDVQFSEPDLSSEQLLELIVRSDPDPNYGLALSLADSAVLLADSDRPKTFVATQFFESQV